MKPKPLIELKNFTVSAFMTISLIAIEDCLPCTMRSERLTDAERGRSPAARFAPETKFDERDHVWNFDINGFETGRG
jgi:hypothetical protein